MTSKVSLPAGQRFMDAPDGFDAREAAELLLAVGPSHLLEPVGTPLADPLIALEATVREKNPIQLASTARRSPAAAERTQTAGKHRTRLEDPRLTGPGSDHVRNPERVIPRPTRHPGRIPQSDVAKNRTRQDVNRYEPGDSETERHAKARQNFGDNMEEVVDYVVPWIPESLFLRDLAEYGAGYVQKWTPGRQKREALVDDMRKHNARRYSNRERAATNDPLTTMLDGYLTNTFGFYGLPTVSGFIEQSRNRAKGKAPSDDMADSRRVGARPGR